MKYAGIVTMTAQEFAELVIAANGVEKKAENHDLFYNAYLREKERADGLQKQLDEYVRRYGDGLDGE